MKTIHRINRDIAYQSPVFSILSADDYALLEIYHQCRIKKEAYVYFEAFQHSNIYMLQ